MQTGCGCKRCSCKSRPLVCERARQAGTRPGNFLIVEQQGSGVLQLPERLRVCFFSHGYVCWFLNLSKCSFMCDLTGRCLCSGDGLMPH